MLLFLAIDAIQMQLAFSLSHNLFPISAVVVSYHSGCIQKMKVYWISLVFKVISSWLSHSISFSFYHQKVFADHRASAGRANLLLLHSWKLASTPQHYTLNVRSFKRLHRLMEEFAWWVKYGWMHLGLLDPWFALKKLATHWRFYKNWFIKRYYVDVLLFVSTKYNLFWRTCLGVLLHCGCWWRDETQQPDKEVQWMTCWDFTMWLNKINCAYIPTAWFDLNHTQPVIQFHLCVIFGPNPTLIGDWTRAIGTTGDPVIRETIPLSSSVLRALWQTLWALYEAFLLVSIRWITQN